MPHVHKDIVANGVIAGLSEGSVLTYVAAAPPNYRYSFTGAGHAFASASQAFYDTPNKGSVRVGSGGRFSIPLAYPNAYYERAGTVRVPPTVFLTYNVGGVRRRASMVVGEGIPYRLRDYPVARKAAGAMFYSKQEQLPVRTQEQVLRDSGYPNENKEAPDFWGLRPPL